MTTTTYRIRITIPIIVEVDNWRQEIVEVEEQIEALEAKEQTPAAIHTLRRLRRLKSDIYRRSKGRV